MGDLLANGRIARAIWAQASLSRHETPPLGILPSEIHSDPQKITWGVSIPWKSQTPKNDKSGQNPEYGRNKWTIEFCHSQIDLLLRSYVTKLCQQAVHRGLLFNEPCVDTMDWPCWSGPLCESMLDFNFSTANSLRDVALRALNPGGQLYDLPLFLGPKEGRSYTSIFWGKDASFCRMGGVGRPCV